VEQGNFDRYRPLRINEMPKVEVHIIASGEAPTGVGEPATPPLGPALANALFAATGARRDVLPLGDRATA
jgi:isoquinoline 1-oxidoreductase beta subunit